MTFSSLSRAACACALLSACGGVTIRSDDTSTDAGTYGRGPDSGADGNGYVEPRCPDAGPPLTLHECDVFGANTCPAGEGCYPASIPPSRPCEAEVYGAFCLGEGTGKQGAGCDDGTDGCAPGYVCLITGTSTSCAKLCDLGGAHDCAGGFVCEPIDVPGFSACL